MWRITSMTILKGKGVVNMIDSITNKNKSVAKGIETESVEKLLDHIAYQTKSIDRKLTSIIDKHVAQDLQNYYNRVNQTLSIIKEKAM